MKQKILGQSVNTGQEKSFYKSNSFQHVTNTCTCIHVIHHQHCLWWEIRLDCVNKFLKVDISYGGLEGSSTTPSKHLLYSSSSWINTLPGQHRGTYIMHFFLYFPFTFMYSSIILEWKKFFYFYNSGVTVCGGEQPHKG